MSERRIASVHVHTGISRGWVVRLSGRSRAFRRFAWRQSALACGRQQATRYGVPLIVHRRDGTVENVDAI